MVLSIGEILVDMIGSYHGNTFCYERNAGGAPFNVACAIKQFGGNSGFVGNVGNDILGKYLVDFAKQRSLDKCLIGSDDNHNTTIAFVELDKSGERSFCFNRKNTADYYLPYIPDSLLERAEIVYVGSLMISEDIGFEYAKNLVKRAKGFKKAVAFDVNFRTDIFRDREEAVKRYKWFMTESDIIKLSEDEVEIFSPQYISGLNSIVCISLGAAGSKWQYQGKSKNVATITVKPIDTTGAGDAFFAGVLTKLSQKSKDEWTAEYLTEALKFGNICGALNTQGKGAIAHLPTLQEVKKYL